MLAVLALLLAAFLLGRGGGGSAAAPLSFGRSIKVTWDPGLEALPAISPDGKTVAYGSGSILRMRIFVRSVSGGRGIALTDDTTQVQGLPQWSPDGSRILFLERGGVFSAPAAGGVETPEVPPGRINPVMSATWSPDGKSIAYVIGDSLFIRDPDSRSRFVARVFEGGMCQWSPDGAHIACASGNAISMLPGIVFGNVSPSKIVVVGVTDESVLTLTDSLSLNQSPVWSADGRWLYYISNRFGPRDIFAQAMSGGKPSGAAVRVTTGLNAHSISLSADGKRLAYASLVIESNGRAVPVPAHPPVVLTTAPEITKGAQLVEALSLSRDGRWVYYDADLAGNMDLYRRELPNGSPERLTNDPTDDFWPELSPDGKEVSFHSWRGGSRDIYVLPLDGSPIQRVTNSPRQEALASWSFDGNRILFCDFSGGGIGIATRVNGVWQPPVWRLNWGWFPKWSPDGKWINFSSRVIQGSLWVMPVDSGAPRLLIDSAGPNGLMGDPAEWSPDVSWVFVRSVNPIGNTTLWSVPLSGGKPRLLITLDRNGLMPSRGGWGVWANQFVFTSPDQQSDVWVMEVVQH